MWAKNLRADNKLARAHMAFQKGNNLGAKGKMFDGALKRAIAQDDGKRLRDAAEKLLDAAALGEPWAINQLADRLDGKPGQSVDVTTHKRVSDYTEDELVAIAFGGGAGTAASQESTSQPPGVH